MKKLTLVRSIAIACSFTAMTANADFPTVVIDTDDTITLDYDQAIDMTGAINVPTLEITDPADVSVNQFNHDSPVSAVGGVSNNISAGGSGITDLHVDVTAVGNNASIELGTDGLVVGAVQGNQNGGASAVGSITGNNINLGTVQNKEGKWVDAEVELNVTAVGNNLTIDGVGENGITGTQLGSVQFNYESPVTATGSINNNGFNVSSLRPRDPKLTVTAVGNNLSAPLGSTGSMLQINRASPISARGFVSGNRGNIGPVNVSVSAVGNNISIKAPSVD
ncbi:MAG: hypothetical protein KAH00_07980 [Cocleimonas sp.]|nr:hypothetical protein [Cocleimonas sp.]